MALELPYHRTPRGLSIQALDAQPLDAAKLARKFEGLLEGNAATEVYGVAPLRTANASDLTFHLGKDWAGIACASMAGIILVPFGTEGIPIDVGAVLQVEDPYAVLCSILQEFHEPLIDYHETKIAWDASIHPTAVVEGTVWPGALIGPHCVVPLGSEVGWNTVLEANVTLYAGARIGRDCVVQAGAVIGARGFGFRKANNLWIDVPHYGGVEIGDRVRIGANSVVAAGFLEPTRIGDDVKLDSFVQIAHHCQVGARVMMASGAGLAGGVIVEDGVEFGGAAQVAQHVHIGEYAKIGAKAGVTHNVPAHAIYAGFPAEPIAIWRRGVIALRKLAKKSGPDNE